MRWRALIALALLVGYATSSAEAVLGEVRDGEVHHESAGAALDHTNGVSPQGEHGHEDEGENTEHGPEHEHGTSVDHCTHSHTASLPSDQLVLGFIDCTLTIPTPLAATRSDDPSSSLFHPPRA